MTDAENTELETATEEEPDYKALYEQAKADADKWKSLSKKNEGRAKHNAGAAKSLEEATAQLADLTQRLEALEGENTSLKANAERSDLVKKVSEETGVPEAIVSTLAATDEEGLTAAAKAIAEAYKPKGAKNPTGGKFPRSGDEQPDGDEENRKFVRQLFGEE